MDTSLSGRTAVVTGSTQGIGLAIATGLAASGAKVAINGRTPERCASAAASLVAEVPDADVVEVAADVATTEGAQALVTAVPDADILVNNLGIFGARPVLEVDDDEWRRYFEVNVLSAVRLTRAYLPRMTARGWGRVQFICSDWAVMVPEEMVHCAMTKTALLAVSRGYAKAAAGTGVTVNAVIAGPAHTDAIEDFVTGLVGDDRPWDEAQREYMRRHHPHSLIQRLIEPAEIANLCAYLASDAASATTGGALRVDGGYVDAILP